MSDGTQKKLDEAAEKLRKLPESWGGRISAMPATDAQTAAMERIAAAAERVAEQSERLLAIAEKLSDEYGKPPLPVFVAVPSDAKPEELRRLVEMLNDHMNGANDAK